MTRCDLLLWTPILVSPAVWFIAMEANFALAPVQCGAGGVVARRAIWLAGLLIILAAAGLAVHLWRRKRMDALPVQGAPADRVRAMALAGVVLSASFFLVIVAQALPDFILGACP